MGSSRKCGVWLRKWDGGAMPKLLFVSRPRFQENSRGCLEARLMKCVEINRQGGKTALARMQRVAGNSVSQGI
jgi:hypothetical protein